MGKKKNSYKQIIIMKYENRYNKKIWWEPRRRSNISLGEWTGSFTEEVTFEMGLEGRIVVFRQKKRGKCIPKKGIAHAWSPFHNMSKPKSVKPSRTLFRWMLHSFSVFSYRLQTVF